MFLFVDEKVYKLPQYECVYCGQVFKKRYLLKRHFPIHTGEKNYSCSICGKSFKSGSTLSRHKVAHRNDLKYDCETCHKEFTRQSSLTAHKLTHSDKKGFECTQCGKTFHQKVNLKHHIMTHTGERPYQCQQCDKSFTQRSNLKQHMLQIHKTALKDKYNCFLCKETFLKLKDLRKHEQNKHQSAVTKKLANQNSTLISSNECETLVNDEDNLMIDEHVQEEENAEECEGSEVNVAEKDEDIATEMNRIETDKIGQTCVSQSTTTSENVLEIAKNRDMVDASGEFHVIGNNRNGEMLAKLTLKNSENIFVKLSGIENTLLSVDHQLPVERENKLEKGNTLNVSCVSSSLVLDKVVSGIADSTEFKKIPEKNTSVQFPKCVLSTNSGQQEISISDSNCDKNLQNPCALPACREKLGRGIPNNQNAFSKGSSVRGPIMKKRDVLYPITKCADVRHDGNNVTKPTVSDVDILNHSELHLDTSTALCHKTGKHGHDATKSAVVDQQSGPDLRNEISTSAAATLFEAGNSSVLNLLTQAFQNCVNNVHTAGNTQDSSLHIQDSNLLHSPSVDLPTLDGMRESVEKQANFSLSALSHEQPCSHDTTVSNSTKSVDPLGKSFDQVCNKSPVKNRYSATDQACETRYMLCSKKIISQKKRHKNVEHKPNTFNARELAQNIASNTKEMFKILKRPSVDRTTTAGSLRGFRDKLPDKLNSCVPKGDQDMFQTMPKFCQPKFSQISKRSVAQNRPRNRIFSHLTSTASQLKESQSDALNGQQPQNNATGDPIRNHNATQLMNFYSEKQTAVALTMPHSTTPFINSLSNIPSCSQMPPQPLCQHISVENTSLKVAHLSSNPNDNGFGYVLLLPTQQK